VPIVHTCTVWDNLAGRRITLTYKYVIERIQQFGGEVVPNTAQEVDSAELNQDGAYTPIGSRKSRSGRAPSVCR
jgi:hypothetical protein